MFTNAKTFSFLPDAILPGVIVFAWILMAAEKASVAACSLICFIRVARRSLKQALPAGGNFAMHIVIGAVLWGLWCFSTAPAHAQNAPTISPASGAYASQPANGVQTATVGGTVTANDSVTITVFDIGLSLGYELVSYTVQPGDTLTSIAAGIATAINADTQLQSINVSATASSAIVSISSASANSTTYTQSVSTGATETIALPIAVTITGDSGANFFFTTDGTQPTPSSTPYSGAFYINGTTTVNAIEVLGGNQSPVSTAFIQIDSTTANLSRNGLELWLKSDNSVATSSSSVTNWGDISGSGNSANQSTTADQPTFKTNAINGLPSVVFNGSTDFLNLPSGFADFTAGATIFIVAKPTAGETVFLDFCNGSNLDNQLDFWLTSTTESQFDVYNSTGSASSVYGSNSVTIGNYQVFEVTHNGVNTAAIYTNGTIYAQSTSMYSIPNTTRSENQIGRNIVYNNGHFNGEIAEILIYNRALSANERRAAEIYLFRRYSVPLYAPTISPSSMISSAGTQTVSITSDANNVILMTLDGTTPTINSMVYTGPFTVSTATTVKAIAAYGTDTSPVTSSYIQFDSNTSGVSRDGLTLWLRSDTGVVTTSAQTIAAWYDSSNSGNTASQSTMANQPAFKSIAANGCPSIVFNGTSNFLSLPYGFADFTAGASIFVVMKPNAPVSNEIMILDLTNSSSSNIALCLEPNALTRFAVLNNGSISQVTSYSGISLGAFQLLGVVHNGVNTATLYTNSHATEQSTNLYAIPNIARSSNRVGSNVGNIGYFNGEISEILIYNRALSSSEMTAVQEYLAFRYAPNIQPSTGVYNTAPVVISSYSGDPVQYTTDGSQPVSTSPLFSQTFQLTNSTVIKAITTTSLGTSPTCTAYVDLDPNAAVVPRSNLNLWLRPDFGLLTTGSSLNRWIDLSGSGMDAVQTNSGNQPQLVANQIIGMPAISFDGATSYMQFPSGFANFTSGAAAFVVTKPAAISNYARFLDLGNGGTSNYIRLYLAAASGAGFTTQTGTSSTNLISTTGMTAGQYQLLEVNHNGAGTAILLNNAAQFAQSTSMNNIDQILRTSNFLGSDYSGSNLLNGQIVELLLYNTSLSQTSRNALESYLLQKYQLLSVIPVAPTFSISGGTLASPMQVAISAPTNIGTFITTDGTTPTANSTPYTGPIQVNYTQTIKAIAIKNGVSSAVSTATYTLDANKYPAPANGDTTTPVINLQVPAPAQ